jgi:prophage regulatory protein
MPDQGQQTGPIRLLTKKQLRELVPLAYSSIWELMRRGEFPKALRIGRQRVAWREDEVREWIESRPRQELKASEEENQ